MRHRLIESEAIVMVGEIERKLGYPRSMAACGVMLEPSSGLLMERCPER